MKDFDMDRILELSGVPQDQPPVAEDLEEAKVSNVKSPRYRFNYVMRWDPKDRERASSLASDAADALGALVEFAYRNPGGGNPREGKKALPGNLYEDASRISGILEAVSDQLRRS